MKALYGVHSMPETAENVADEFAISRADQDVFALRSQLRTAAAQEAGRFADELIAVQVPQRKASRCCLAAMSTRAAPRWRRWLNCAAWCAPTAALPPVTPPGLTTAPARCCWPARRRCRLTIFSRGPGGRRGDGGRCAADHGVWPGAGGAQGAGATGLTLGQMDVIELNEAFAAQALAVTRDLGLPDDAAT
ncbi:acetyl-CoA acetyltransferase [Klebsiella pneumoniae]|nr:acetyl-CoA acetyltransferase [Klebsiella pneumoniae]